MNIFTRILIATLGGINLIFGIFIPIAVALILIISYPGLGVFSQWVLILAGSLSSLYKAIDVAVLRRDS